MSELEAYLYQRVAQEIRSWDGTKAQDIYVISLHVSFVDDDTRQGVLNAPCYNTMQYWQSKGGASVDRWRLYDEFCGRWTLCEPIVEEWGNQDSADPAGVMVRNQYLADLSLFISDAEHDYFWDHLFRKKGRSGQPGFPIFTTEDAEEYDRYQEKSSRNGEAFINVCAAVIYRLHDDGVIQEICGRSVPVVLHISNDMDDLAVYAWHLTRQVNPLGIADEWAKSHLARFGLSE